MDYQGYYEDPTFRNHQGEGYREGPPLSPQVPWRYNIPTRNQYGPLQGCMENVEETDYYGTTSRPGGNQQGHALDGPSGAAPLRNSVDIFLGRGQNKKED